MKWEYIEKIARSLSEPGKPPRFYVKIHEVADILGCDRGTASQFLARHKVPYERISRDKKFFLPDVMEAVEGTKWSRETSRKYV